MKILLAPLLLLCTASAFASGATLLENALSCKLKDVEVESLMRNLAASQPAFAKPAKQVMAPSADIYRMAQPVTALGYSSTEVVVTPGRILLAVPGTPLKQAIGKLNLTEEPYSPAKREIRPTVSVVAFQMSSDGLEGKLLVGCEYANAAAARWVEQ